MRKKSILILFACVMLGTIVGLPPFALVQNGPQSGVLPAGPGGRDVSTPPPPPRPDPLPTFYDANLPVQKRVDDLISRLSLEEKVSLMQMASPSIPRLGIAPYHWWTEALHGMTHG